MTRSTTTTSPQTEHSKHWTSGSPSISGSRACSRSPDERSHFGQAKSCLCIGLKGCVLMIGGGQITLDTTARSLPKCGLCDDWSLAYSLRQSAVRHDPSQYPPGFRAQSYFAVLSAGGLAALHGSELALGAFSGNARTQGENEILSR